MQNSFRGRIIAIPKAPNGNENQVKFF